jgi:hypothetical protein
MRNFYLVTLLVLSFAFVFWGCQEALSPEQNSTSEQQYVESTIPPDYPPKGDGCVRTPGYWKNHPEAIPGDFTFFYGEFLLDKEGIVEALKQPVKGNKWITLYKAVIAARLNIKVNNANDCDGKITSLINEGFDSLIWALFNNEGVIKANRIKWKLAEPIYLELDDYNNGFLCAPACD